MRPGARHVRTPITYISLIVKKGRLINTMIQKKKTLRVAVLANLKTNAPRWDDMPEDQWDDLDSEKTVMALVEAVRAGGYESEFFEGDKELFKVLPKYKPDICFNICEGHFGNSREALVPAILELLKIPYTGSNVLTLALALDKPMTKRIFHYHDLPTPAFQVFERPNEPLNDDLKFPLFVKPSHEGTSAGVTSMSVVRTEAELRERVAYTHERYKQPALVETFIEGREVTVGIAGNLVGPTARRLPENLTARRITAGLHFFPAMEVDLKPFLDSDAVYSNHLKVALAEELTYLCPAPLSDEMAMELNWLAAAVFRVTGAKDVSRVDFR